MRLYVLQQDRLSEQITECDSKRPRHIRKHIKPANLPLATLDLAQPVLSTTHQVSENNPRQYATTPVEGNTLADAELITRTPHAPTLPAVSDCAVVILRPGAVITPSRQLSLPH